MGVGRGGWRWGQPSLSPLVAHGGKRLSHRLRVTATLSCQCDSFPGERRPCQCPYQCPYQCPCQGPCRAQVDFGTVCSASCVASLWSWVAPVSPKGSRVASRDIQKWPLHW